jgi:hypothetical protein
VEVTPVCFVGSFKPDVYLIVGGWGFSDKIIAVMYSSV